MRAPVRLVRGGWPPVVERRLSRFMRDDPRILVRSDVTPDQFRRAMSNVHVGDTIKITGTNRHPVADELLLANVDTTGKTIADIGASDGSTALDLIAALPDFGSYIIADLYLSVEALELWRHLFVYDNTDAPILVSGRWALAWPSQSRGVRALYRPLLARAERFRARRTELLLLNPAVRELMRTDPRVTCRVHDVFQVWDGAPPDVIKVANLLRRLYFADADISRALAALHASLPDGGHLLIVDNPRIAGISARAGLYRRHPGGFNTVSESEHTPEISNLVGAFTPAESVV